ncbi:putative 29.1 kDa protein in cryB1 5primeregion [Diplonema papillatum]|nr:putative 29.1 kDa protein in cryB1 5primeregion [Diplonema papillatum]
MLSAVIPLLMCAAQTIHTVMDQYDPTPADLDGFQFISLNETLMKLPAKMYHWQAANLTDRQTAIVHDDGDGILRVTRYDAYLSEIKTTTVGLRNTDNVFGITGFDGGGYAIVYIYPFNAVDIMKNHTVCLRIYDEEDKELHEVAITTYHTLNWTFYNPQIATDISGADNLVIFFGWYNLRYEHYGVIYRKDGTYHSGLPRDGSGTNWIGVIEVPIRDEPTIYGDDMKNICFPKYLSYDDLLVMCGDSYRQYTSASNRRAHVGPSHHGPDGCTPYIGTTHVCTPYVSPAYSRTRDISPAYHSPDGCTSDVGTAHVCAADICSTYCCTAHISTTHVCAPYTRSTHTCTSHFCAADTRPAYYCTADIRSTHACTSHICSVHISSTHHSPDVCTANICTTHVCTTHVSAPYTRSTHICATHVCAPYTLSTHTCATHIRTSHVGAPYTRSTDVCAPYTLSTHTCATHIRTSHVGAPYTRSTDVCAPYTLSTHTCATHIRTSHVGAPYTRSTDVCAPYTLSTHTCATHIRTSHVGAPYTRSTDVCAPYTRSTNTCATHVCAPYTRSTHTCATDIRTSHVGAPYTRSTHTCAIHVSAPYTRSSHVCPTYINSARNTGTHRTTLRLFRSIHYLRCREPVRVEDIVRQIPRLRRTLGVHSDKSDSFSFEWCQNREHLPVRQSLPT